MNDESPGLEPENKVPNLFWHRVKLLTLITVFLSPFIGGWMALYVFNVKPGSGNYGSLIIPVQRLQWSPLQTVKGESYAQGFGRKWTLVMFSGDKCAELCRSNLYYMRQLRTLLGRDTLRLQNVMISARELDQETAIYLQDFPNVKVVENYRDAMLYRQFELEGHDAVGSTPRLYLVDPDQNLMMHYPAENDPDRILEDIKKLMKISQIG